MSIVEEGVRRLMTQTETLYRLREMGVISERVHKEMLKAALDELFAPKTEDALTVAGETHRTTEAK